jgi:hypothetical protein
MGMGLSLVSSLSGHRVPGIIEGVIAGLFDMDPLEMSGGEVCEDAIDLYR